ncbi:MAG: DnaJ domain-containing protein [Desulfobacterales bacterium]|jgi:curved DNA-binding protein CbpA
MKKYYEILGLDMSASIEEVEQAYKKLSETWRPQTYQNLPRYRRKAEIKSKEIDEAYKRVKTFLLTKLPDRNQDEDQKNFVAPDGMPLESEPQSISSEETIPSQNSKLSNRKAILYGLIAIAVVLGASMVYQISDRKKPQQQGFQTAFTAEEKPAVATSSQPASALPVHEEFEAESAGESAAQGYNASTGKQKINVHSKIDYDVLLTEAALNKYSRDPERVKRAQKSLIAGGYDTGPIDGIIGPQTTAALKQFASDHAVEAGSLFASDLTGAVLVYAEVAATHPDWHSIIGSDDFASWLDRQSYYLKSSIQNLKQSATARQVIEILNRYKSEKK